jgi:ectoine hydroxylase-related dioxygenase (phytanoyl-CoA dioxygenase family)|tara:strand:- start:159 stop:932 length:774 start_codon:yes stop_codon:yes gene_type:complete
MIMYEMTSEDKSGFDRDGYLIVRSLFDKQEMSGLLKFAEGDEAMASDAYVRRDADGGETRLAVRNELDDALPYTAVVRSARIVRTMESLFDDEVYHYHHKMMFKQPRIGGAWEWHQDYGYWYNNGCLFPDMGSCMLAVDQATKQNGCLQVLRGSHKIGRVEHVEIGDQVGADPERVASAQQQFELVYCELEPGDGLFFHSNLLHRSDQNLSDTPRWSLICCYNTKHNDPYVTDGRHPNYSPLEVWSDDQVNRRLTEN